MRPLSPKEKELEKLFLELLTNSESIQKQIAQIYQSSQPVQDKRYNDADITKMVQMQSKITKLEKTVSDLEEYKYRYEELKTRAEQEEILIKRLKQDNDMLKEECGKYRREFEKVMFDNEVLTRLLEDEKEKLRQLTENSGGSV